MPRTRMAVVSLPVVQATGATIGKLCPIEEARRTVG